MNHRTFFANPDYLEYVRLLSALHHLIRGGTDETPPGEVLRDRMDRPGSRLSPEEVVSVNGISADFYSLIDPPPTAVLSPTASFEADLRAALEARDRRDFGRALDLVRKCAPYIEPAALSHLRGTIWGEAGESWPAVPFFQHAAQLDPKNGSYTELVLHHLSRVDAEAASANARWILEDPDRYPPRTVLYAADILFQATREQSEDEARPILESLIPVFEQVVVRMEVSGEGSSHPSLLAMAFALTGFCYEHLDRHDTALRFYDRGLSLFPENDSLRVARGILRYGRDTERSVRDFERAIRRGSPIVWPYFYLAHHALLRDRPAECLDLCNRALQFPASDEVQAHLMEWMAISQATLGYPAPAVESAFQAALRLAPGDDRIARNSQAFRESRRPDEIGWDRGDEQLVRAIGERGMRPAA